MLAATASCSKRFCRLIWRRMDRAARLLRLLLRLRSHWSLQYLLTA